MEPGELKDTAEEIAGREGDQWLNRAIAIAVVISAVFMAVSKVKDDNIVQGMQQAQADRLDQWNYFQAKSTKGHLYEIQIDTWELRAKTANPPLTPAASAEVAKKVAKWKASVARYEKEKAEIKRKAEEAEKTYDALNYRDDQFDFSDALLGLAVALFALASLVRSRPVFCVGFGFAVFGIVMGLAGFFQWRIHPGVIKFLN